MLADVIEVTFNTGHDRDDLEGERPPRERQVEVVLEQHGAGVDSRQQDVVEQEAVTQVLIEDEPALVDEVTVIVLVTVANGSWKLRWKNSL